MAIDSRGIYRGECFHPGCRCRDFQNPDSGSSKCSGCGHPPASHRAFGTPQQPGSGSGSRTAAKPVASYGTDKGGKESHPTAPPLHSHHNQQHHHGHPSSRATGGMSGQKTCLTCDTTYSPVDLGACPKCCPRQSCRSGCGKPAFCTLDLGPFGYCSAECRDRCELERAKSEVTRALKEFEVMPGSTKTPAKEPVSHNATPHVQPLTRPRRRSEDTPTIVGATCEAPPTQKPPSPQEQVTVGYQSYKVSIAAVHAMSLYDSGKLQAMKGTKGLLVTSVEVNKDTLECGVHPLDLITHLDGKSADKLCDFFGRCSLLSIKMTKSTADVWVARTLGIPSMSLIQRFEELPIYQSGRKHRIVGLLATQKDLVDPASFLGVSMDKYSNIKMVDRVSVMSEGEKAGLHYNDIIHSVTLVTAEKAFGPYAEWSFEGIKRVAKDSPSVCALLLTVARY